MMVSLHSRFPVSASNEAKYSGYRRIDESEADSDGWLTFPQCQERGAALRVVAVWHPNGDFFYSGFLDSPIPLLKSIYPKVKIVPNGGA